jgi:uncharacterized RDD family membrane protein YckC
MPAFFAGLAARLPGREAAVERTVDVATGESVAFRYELAGLGSRFYALFIDLAIQIAVLIAALLLLSWIGTSLPSLPAATGRFAKVASAFLLALAIFAAFMLFFGYFIVFEWRWGGRTPGKRLLGIRVVRDGGFPLDFTSAAVRNIVRIVETALGFYALSAVVSLLSPENRRLGDMAAGTLVVRDERYERAKPAATTAALKEDPVVRELSEPERDLIRRFAARCESLRPEARSALAGSIAAGIRPKLTASYAHLSDEDLLVFLAQNALA